MKFAFLPASNDDTASSRIRVFTLERALTALGHSVAFGITRDAEVCFIQKRVTWEILQEVRKAKERGSVILYDLDDLGDALWYFTSQRCFYEMLQMADVVTTDTAGHKEELVRRYAVKRIDVIPDTIDYFPSGPVRVSTGPGKPLRILWFGDCCNMPLFEKYAVAMTRMPGVVVVVATNEKVLRHYSAKYPTVTFVPWSRNSFLCTLQSCDLSCLMHDGSELDRAKSNNKMIASITWGVPAIVSRTPEYERTAREVGVESVLFSNEQELCAAVERLRPREARIGYLNRTQAHIWSRYSPQVVAKKFLETATTYTESEGKFLAPARVRLLQSRGYGLIYKCKRRIGFELWRSRLAGDRLKSLRSVAREGRVAVMRIEASLKSLLMWE